MWSGVVWRGVGVVWMWGDVGVEEKTRKRTRVCAHAWWCAWVCEGARRCACVRARTRVVWGGVEMV